MKEVDEVEGDNKCPICGKFISSSHFLCYECYKEAENFSEDFDRNQPLYKLKNHYDNLESSIKNNIKDLETAKFQCKRLFALAIIANNSYGDSSLMHRAKNQIARIIEYRTIKKETSESKKETKQERTRMLVTFDGHAVQSHGEMLIDNILYELRLLHAYAKIVDEITTNDRTIECDFFIHFPNSDKGVYIEYWGMDTDSYNKNKEEKRSLYEKYNLPLIEIEKDDVNEPTSLKIRIKREYNTHLNKYKGF